MPAMGLTPWILAALLAWSLGAMAWVWRWRGRTRYGLSQYLRKSWPVFAPLNCVLYLATRSWARGAFVDPALFPGTALLRAHWREIRDEAMRLLEDDALERASAPGSVGAYDIGFRTFRKRGWRRFYLRWYGTTHRSAERTCPRTLALLSQVPRLRGAMFSLLPPGATLSLHSDPMACALRYHLGLSTPGSDDCRIVVDGEPRAWRDGEDMVFDETYPHHAENRGSVPRLILMCDIERPVYPFARAFNLAYMRLAAALLVPNTDEDRRGAFSALFARVAPVVAAGARLRERRRRAYRLAKTAVNVALLGLLLLPLALLLSGIDAALAG